MDDITPESQTLMPAIEHDARIVLEHTHGPMNGIHSICGLKSAAIQPLPEFLDTVDLIDAPSMRTPGPVSLVAVKRRFVLYRQISTPEQTKTFNKSQR